MKVTLKRAVSNGIYFMPSHDVPGENSLNYCFQLTVTEMINTVLESVADYKPKKKCASAY